VHEEINAAFSDRFVDNLSARRWAVPENPPSIRARNPRPRTHSAAKNAGVSLCLTYQAEVFLIHLDEVRLAVHRAAINLEVVPYRVPTGSCKRRISSITAPDEGTLDSLRLVIAPAFVCTVIHTQALNEDLRRKIEPHA
jgi:hypothetical protein